ncbi:hypothetical protein K8T06_03515 [bacterium]|nr:hypothetical protein [bacterium]
MGNDIIDAIKGEKERITIGDLVGQKMLPLLLGVFLISIIAFFAWRGGNPLSKDHNQMKTPRAISGIGSIHTNNYANRELKYYFHIPSTISVNNHKSHPLLVLIPGLSGKGEAFVSLQYKNFAKKENFIIVSPSFVWDEKNWDTQTSYQYPSAWSGKALIQIVDQLKKKFGIEISDYYLFGFSAGAQFALRFCVWKPNLCRACAVHGSGGGVEPTEYNDVAFFVTVGNQDTDSRQIFAEVFCDTAKKVGINTVCRKYDVGHWLSTDQINDSFDFFRRIPFR